MVHSIWATVLYSRITVTPGIRPIGKSIMTLGTFCLAGMVLLSHGMSARAEPSAKTAASKTAASFDCAKAKSGVEKTICADPQLRDADREMAETYRSLSAGSLTARLRQEAAQMLRQDQVEWLKNRESCMSVKPETGEDASTCLLARMKQRQMAMHSLADNEHLALLYAVTTIPNDPKGAAATIRSFDRSNLAAGWLAYLARFVPESGVTRQEGDKAMAAAVASIDDDSDSDILKGENDPDRRLLLLLRFLIKNDSESDRLPCAHLFLFKRHPDLAIATFGGIYGSSRDADAPYCRPPYGLFDIPAWRLLETAFSGPTNNAMETMGTMVHGNLASMKVDEIVSDLLPDRLVKDGDAQLKKGLDRLKAWNDFERLPKDNVARAIAAAPLVERETTAWIIKQRGLPPDQAVIAARGMVGAYLNRWLDFLEGPEGAGDPEKQ